MPGGDRTGPVGAGPMTGRGAGFCGADARTAYGGQGFRRGGRGWRNRFLATGQPRWLRSDDLTAAAQPDREVTTLQNEARRLQEQLDTIVKRIAELTT